MIATNSFAQTPIIEWQNYFGGSSYDSVYDQKQTLDGGYILIGGTNSPEVPFYQSNSDILVIKISNLGVIEWQKAIGGDLNDSGTNIIQTADGGYLICGETSSNNGTFPTNYGETDIYLLKLDFNGNVMWQKSIGGDKADRISSLSISSNNTILIGANSFSSISGDKSELNYGYFDYWVLELDDLGNIIWQKTLGGSNNETLTTFDKTSDDGYIIGGYTSSGISGNKTENSFGQNDFWIIKLDSNKNIEWQKTIGGTDEDQSYAIYETNDNGYIIGGTSNSDISGNKTESSKGSYDFWVMKLDSFGTILWQKTIGGINSDGISSIDKTLDGYFLLCGNSSSPISGDKTDYNRGLEDVWIVKIDENGNIIWDKTIGGSNQDYNAALKHTSDNGFIIAANSNSGISGEKTEYATSTDYWIVKLSPDSLSNNTDESTLFSIYPNPTSGTITIKLNSTFDDYTITTSNVIGQIIKQEKISTTNLSID